MQPLKPHHLRPACLLLCAMLIPVWLFGQATDGSIVGNVTDASGAALASAKVELTNIDTTVTATSTADSTGFYRFRNVLVGRYKVTVTAPGFGASTVQNITVAANAQLTVNVSMQVANVNTTVEVVEAPALIDTTTARITNSFESRQALALPVTGVGNLGVINLSLQGSGVTSGGGSIGYGTGPAVGGQRPTNNNFMIEGVDNNNKSVTGPIVNVSNEAVAQFSLMQNQFSPEFGYSSGGQFNTIVKSGTNEIHGSVFHYMQNRKMDAIDESIARTQLRPGSRVNPRNDRNRLGGTIGGPVLKNKLFYFGSYEYVALGQASVNTAAIFVPTAEGIRLLDNLSGIRKTNLDIFKREVPVAASASAGQTTTVRGTQIPLGILSVSAPSFRNDYNAVASGDYNISDRDQLRMRYLSTRIDLVDTTANLPQFFQPRPIRNHVASLTHFHTFTPSVTNELRLAYNRRTDEIPAGDFAFPGVDAFPNLTFDDLGLIIGPNPNAPQGNRSNSFQLVNNMNWVKGRHSFKFGYDGRKLNISNFFVQRNRGDYQYSTLDAYLTDVTPNFAQRSVGGFPFIGNMLSHFGFAHDEWRLRQNLTLNIGLRYEFVGVPTGAKQQALNSLASVPGLVVFGEPKATKRDFTPRIGLAWSPGKSGLTSIRAGFGMAYDQVYQNLGTNSLPPQFFTTIDAHIDRPGQPNFLATGGIPGAAIPISNAATARRLTSSFIPDQLRPYSIQWNLGVQRVFWNDYTLEVRYLGTRGVHLPLQQQINRIPTVTSPEQGLPTFLQRPSQTELDALTRTLDQIPTAGAASNFFASSGFGTSITAFMPQGNSTYHGLATQLNKRFSKNLLFTGAYTWSHTIDDSTASLNSTAITPRRPQDFFNLRPERASSALDRRHRFTMSWVYDTPWFTKDANWAARNLLGNWTFSGFYQAETGPWGTVRSGVDSNQNGDPVADRTIINPSGQANRGSGVTQLRNSAGRVVGYLANDPSARYIQAGVGAFPTGGRNTLRLPGINNFDITVAKKINISESKFFEIRGEAYNALNNSQFVPGFVSSVAPRVGLSGNAVGNILLPQHPNFNRPDLAFSNNSRTMQIVARFQF
ncbi:MAG: TonB-dependent receptor [Bryobacterales bacterium]|nr:TonB-dependent receptor [Bryobacterales bacterium]